MQAFKVSGTFHMGTRHQIFSVESVGDDEDQAVERVLSTIGSRHRVKRRFISITDVQPLKTDDARNPRVRALLGA